VDLKVNVVGFGYVGCGDLVEGWGVVGGEDEVEGVGG
jgi:hypothetical protein